METLVSWLSKGATSTALDISEWLLLLAAIVVVVGLYAEHKMPSRHPKHKCFAMLIIIGCSGEVFADGAIFLFSRHLQIISDAEDRWEALIRNI